MGIRIELDDQERKIAWDLFRAAWTNTFRDAYFDMDEKGIEYRRVVERIINKLDISE